MSTTVEKQPCLDPPKKRPNWSEISAKADFGKNLRREGDVEYKIWLTHMRLMSVGSDLGQIEPWWPLTFREIHYDGWADGDFETLLSLLGEGTRIGEKNNLHVISSSTNTEEDE